MTRRLFTIAAALSLWLCLATVVVWVRSYHHGDRWERETKPRSEGVTIYAGRIEVFTTAYVGTPNDNGVARDGRWRHWRDDRRNIISDPVALTAKVRSTLFGKGSGSGHTALGWGYGWWTWVIPGIGTRFGHQLIVPVWAVFSSSFVLPAIRLSRLLRERRKTGGLCPKCSYNLTGNTSGICPECGTAVPYPANSPALADKSPRPA